MRILTFQVLSHKGLLELLDIQTVPSSNMCLLLSANNTGIDLCCCKELLDQTHVRIALLLCTCLSSQANEILSSFDDRLRQYATKQLIKVRYVQFIQSICIHFIWLDSTD